MTERNFFGPFSGAKKIEDKREDPDETVDFTMTVDTSTDADEAGHEPPIEKGPQQAKLAGSRNKKEHEAEWIEFFESSLSALGWVKGRSMPMHLAAQVQQHLKAGTIPEATMTELLPSYERGLDPARVGALVIDRLNVIRKALDHGETAKITSADFDLVEMLVLNKKATRTSSTVDREDDHGGHIDFPVS